MSNTTTATKPNQSQRARDGVGELFVDANLLFFQGAAGITIKVSIYHPGGSDSRAEAFSQVPIGCGEGDFGCIVRSPGGDVASYVYGRETRET